jgi:hypothetical protein
MNQANGAHSFVGGGCDNVVDGACSSILGGYKNYVAGDCSVILGGANNNDMGMAYVGIFGNGITAVAANTFHVENAWANGNVCVIGQCVTIPNIQPLPTGPSGTLYYMLVGGLKQVFVV